MMKVFTGELSVRTRGKGTYEITSEVERLVRESGVTDGQVITAADAKIGYPPMRVWGVPAAGCQERGSGCHPFPWHSLQHTFRDGGDEAMVGLVHGKERDA